MNEIFSRASVRQFEPRPVEQEKVEQLLRAAMAAPSARNQQPWEFYAVTNRETLDALAACSLYALSLKGAPLGIVICGRRNCSRPEYAQIDCSAAAENILLEAVSQGLGAVWLGIAPIEMRMEATAQALNLPEDLYVFAIIACGYPAVEPKPQDRYDPSRVHWLT